jgi:uncharacterized protein (TIGR02118 family)
MLKVISLMRRADGMSKDEFITWITEEHVKFAREIPGLRRFVVNVTPADADTPYDSVNELYFDDDDARVAAFASSEGKASGADAAAHTSDRVHIVTTARELI